MEDPQQLTLEEWLRQDGGADAAEVVKAIGAACQDVAVRVRTASCDSTSCFNNAGEEQLAIDVVAEEVLIKYIRACSKSTMVSTPWDQELQQSDAEEECEYSVALNALDGSSIIDTNFAVGSLFAIWRAPSLLNVTGRELVAAGACSYGPRTALSVAIKGRPGVQEFLLVGEAAGAPSWVASNRYEVMEEGKLYAPGNLPAINSNAGYGKLLRFWQDNNYLLRFTGGIVLDVMQLLVKGFGVFAMPAALGQRPRSLLLYEAIPLAYLVETAGGASSDGAISLLDIKVVDVDQRVQIALGSSEEVRRFDEMVGAVEVDTQAMAV